MIFLTWMYRDPAQTLGVNMAQKPWERIFFDQICHEVLSSTESSSRSCLLFLDSVLLHNPTETPLVHPKPSQSCRIRFLPFPSLYELLPRRFEIHVSIHPSFTSTSWIPNPVSIPRRNVLQKSIIFSSLLCAFRALLFPIDDTAHSLIGFPRSKAFLDLWRSGFALIIDRASMLTHGVSNWYS